MNEEQKKEVEDYLSGNNVKPPRGSVFDDFDLRGGPPMLRMIMLQMAFAFIAKIQGVSSKVRALLIGCVCAFFLFSDMNSFLEKRNPNLYQLIGAHRTADADFLNERLDMALACYQEADEEHCSSFNFKEGNALNKTEIEQIRYVLVKK